MKEIISKYNIYRWLPLSSDRMTSVESTYTPLHPNAGENDNPDVDEGHPGELIDENELDDDSDEDDHHVHDSHKHAFKKEVLESFDFNDVESMMWRKVILSHSSKQMIVCCLFVSNHNNICLFFLFSINFVDTIKERGNSGVLLGLLPPGNGFWLF